MDAAQITKIAGTWIQQQMWSSPQRRWTTGGAALGLVAGIVTPNMGLAGGGGAVPTKLILIVALILILGLVGNRIGVAREAK